MTILKTIPQGPLSVLRNGKTFYDIDEAREDYLKILKKEYAIDIPDFVAVDKRLLYKYIKDFYQIKGTDSAFLFLFRIFFDEDIEVYHPIDRVLRTSDGRWVSPRTLKLSNTYYDSDIYSSVGYRITGSLSGASGIVDSVISYQDGPNEVFEVFLSPGSGTGVFDTDDLVSWNNGVAEVYSAVIGYNIVTAGTGYTEGDLIYISDTPLGASGTATARISSVDSNGGIKKIDSIIFGSGYGSPPDIDLTGLGDGNAEAVAIVGADCNYRGYYNGVYGQLSESIRLQDSIFYQAYSYVIRSGVSINTWKTLIEKVGHPSGYKLFGESMIDGFADVSSASGIDTTIDVDRTGIDWVNNSSSIIPWFNKYNNQVTWANS